MSKQLDRVEDRLNELNQMVGGLTWYFEEALDFLAILEAKVNRIEMKLGIEPEELPPPEPRRRPAPSHRGPPQGPQV